MKEKSFSDRLFASLGESHDELEAINKQASKDQISLGIKNSFETKPPPGYGTSATDPIQVPGATPVGTPANDTTQPATQPAGASPTQGVDLPGILKMIDAQIADEAKGIEEYGKLHNAIFWTDPKILQDVQKILTDERNHYETLNKIKDQLLAPATGQQQKAASA